jgi:hypothetical protein
MGREGAGHAGMSALVDVVGRRRPEVKEIQSVN